MAGLAFFVGALLLVRVIVILSQKVFLRSEGARYILMRNLVALGVATVLGGFGREQDGAPQFADAFLRYLLPAAASFLYDSVKARRNRTRNGEVSTRLNERFR